MPEPVTGDPVAAYLAGVREDIAGQDKLVARMATSSVDVREFNATQDRLAEHVPRLLAAVEAALGKHRPVQTYQMAVLYAAPTYSMCGHPLDMEDWDKHHERADDRGAYKCLDKPLGIACSSCHENDHSNDPARWPCPEYQAISSALLGEEAPGD
jgi:hypothetical protein